MLGHLLLENFRQAVDQFHGVVAVDDVEAVSAVSAVRSLDEVSVVPLVSVRGASVDPMFRSTFHDTHREVEHQIPVLSRTFCETKDWLSLEHIGGASSFSWDQSPNEMIRYGLECSPSLRPHAVVHGAVACVSSIRSCEALRRVVHEVCEKGGICTFDPSDISVAAGIWKLLYLLEVGAVKVNHEIFMSVYQTLKRSMSNEPASASVVPIEHYEQTTRLNVQFGNDTMNKETLWRVVIETPTFIECSTSLVVGEETEGDIAVTSFESGVSGIKFLNSKNRVVVCPQAAMLCGIGKHSIVLKSLVQWQSESLSANQHLHEACRACLPALAKQVLLNICSPRVTLFPFFRDGAIKKSHERAVIAPLKTFLRIREDDWQSNVVEGVFEALSTCCAPSHVEEYLKKRWRLDWVSVFQGEANQELRVQLCNLCMEVASFAKQTIGGDPRVASTTLQSWLRQGLTSTRLNELLSERAENLATARIVLSVCEQDIEASNDILKYWATTVSVSNMWDFVEGSPSQAICELRGRFAHLLLATKACVRKEIFTRHLFDADLLDSLLQATAISTQRIPRKCTKNAFFCTAPGVRISRGADGTSEIHRTAMGPMCFKAIRALPLASDFTNYFEVRFGAKNIKRAIVGFCAPQDTIEASGVVRAEVQKRSWFIESSGKGEQCTPFGGGDVVGYGVSTEMTSTGAVRKVWATLNKKLLFSKSMEVPQLRNGSAAIESIVPFVSWDATEQSVAVVNFGDSPFLAEHEVTIDNDDSCNALIEQGIRNATTHDVVLDLISRDMNAHFTDHFASLMAKSLALTPANAARLMSMLTSSPRVTPSGLHAIATLIERGSPGGVQVIPPPLAIQHPSKLIFSPHWVSSSEESSFVNGPTVKITEEHYLAHAVGTPIPSRGKCTFSIFINYQGTEQKQVQNFGQFYVGVTTLTVASLSSTSWGQSDPPTVWGVHSIASAQLRHCNDSAFAGDHYTFSANSVVTLEIDRGEGTMSVSRGGKTFSHVFCSIPQDAKLYPFVQLVDENTSATLLPGQREATVAAHDAVLSANIRVQRALLCSSETEGIVGNVLEKGLQEGGQPLSTVMRVIGAAAPSLAVEALTLPHCEHVTGVLVDFDEVQQRACLLIDGAIERWFPLELVDRSVSHVRDANPLEQLDVDDDQVTKRVGTFNFGEAPMRGVAAAAVAAVNLWREQLLSPSRLQDEELRARLALEDEANYDMSRIDSRMSSDHFKSLLRINGGLMSALFQNATIPPTHTFNVSTCSPQLRLPKHYNGKLVISPAVASKDGVSCFAAIANEAISAEGIVNIRLRVEFEWMGLIPLGNHPMQEGFYVGVCSEQYLGSTTDFTRLSPTQIWAATSFDTKEWHLPHSCHEPTSSHQIFSGDVLRLLIHRGKGTMEVFRTPKGRGEVSLGVLFRDIPAGKNLFPFVRISSSRTAVLFLPESAILPRPIANQMRCAVSLKSKTHSCDGCLNQLVHAMVEAPNWYRCNECLDFDLCPTCFQGHYHPGHSFTHMKFSSFLPSSVHDVRQLTHGSDVEVSAAPLFPLRVDEASFDARSTSVIVKASDCQSGTVAGGLWGIIRKATSPIEVAARFINNSDNVNCRVAAGIAPLSLLEGMSFTNFVAMMRLPTRPRGVALFSSCTAWLDHTGSPLDVLVREQRTMWSSGDSVVFHVAKDLASAEATRCGVPYRRYSESRMWSSTDALAFFVISERNCDITLEVTTQQTPVMTGKIGEIDAKRNLFRVTNGVASRWCHGSQLTLPLEPIKHHNLLRQGLSVYIPSKETSNFTPCVVTQCGDVDAVIYVHDGTRAFPASLDSIFVPRFVNTTRDADDDHTFPDVKKRLRRFYAKYAPTKTEDEMDKAIELYSKRSTFSKMFEDLQKKYGPEPEPHMALPSQPLVGKCGMLAKDVLSLIDVLRVLLKFSESDGLRTALSDASIIAIAPLLDYLSRQQLPSADDDVEKWVSQLDLHQLDASRTRVELTDHAVPVAAPLLPLIAPPAPIGSINPVPLEGVLTGTWKSQVTDFAFTVTVDCTSDTTAVEFHRGGQVASGQYLLTFPIQSREWNAATQRLRLALGAPDDADGFGVLALMCGDPFSSSASLPLVLRKGEYLLLDAAWDAHQKVLAGSWKATTGHRGSGVLKPDQHRQEYSAWCLPAPATVEELLASSTTDRMVRRTDFGTVVLKIVAYLAMRLRLQWVDACLADQPPARLIHELAHALPSIGVQRVLSIVSQLPPQVQAGIFQQAMSLSTQAAATNLHARITCARIIAHLAPSQEGGFWPAVYAVVSSLLRQWNALDLLDALATLTKQAPPTELANLATALAPLYHHFASVSCAPFANSTYLSLTMDIFRPVVHCMALDAFPVRGVAMLVDVAQSMEQGRALPLCLESWATEEMSLSRVASKWSPCGEASIVRGATLVIGSAWSPMPQAQTAVYFEGTMSGNSLSIGVCAPSEADTPPQESVPNSTAKKRKFGPLVGFTATSIGFDGTTVFTNGRGTRVGHALILGSETLGALIHPAENWIEFSVNGVSVGRFPLPAAAPTSSASTTTAYCAVVRCTSSPSGGSVLRTTHETFLSLPTGATPLHGAYRDCSSVYDAQHRCTNAVAPLQQWAETAQHNQQAALSECFQRTLPFVDLSIFGEQGLAHYLPTLKRMILPSLRRELAFIPPLEAVERKTLPNVAVKWFELFSQHDRSSDEALSRTVLSQLHRQLGGVPAALGRDPMFVTSLMMTESKHTPIDAGGPYSQVWSLLAEELMTENSELDTTTAAVPSTTQGEEPSKADSTSSEPATVSSGPKQKFHRNPMFRFGSSAKGKVLVPEKHCSSAHHLQLFTFFGALMGYLLRSKRCLALELSPIVWKHLTEEPLTAADFIDGVDASLQASLQDDDFLDSPEAEAMFPGMGARLAELSHSDPSESRRSAAEWALTHSLDQQLNAVRDGFWMSIPRSTTRLLLPTELGLKVCGEPFPSWEQVQQSITVSLPPAAESMFWAAMKALTPAEWSGFFYFASAQRRYPLSRKISVTPTQQSEKHIPQASTCFNHVSTPLYSTELLWITKLRQAISCQDMELA